MNKKRGVLSPLFLWYSMCKEGDFMKVSIRGDKMVVTKAIKDTIEKVISETDFEIPFNVSELKTFLG